MKTHFPLSFEFKIGTLANDFVIKDSRGQLLTYVRQKMFKLKEDILCYSDESKSNLMYRIRANKWIDFSATYTFSDGLDYEIGRVGRKGMASLWRARYEIFDKDLLQEFMIQEENAWAKVFDVLLSEVPILGMFTGYFFNPRYKVVSNDGEIVMRLTKDASFWGRRFTVSKFVELDEQQQERILLSLMMMILLERRRG